MLGPGPGFPLFPQLPLELREEIWRFCLPHRVRELDNPVAENVYHIAGVGPVPCKLQSTTRFNVCPPLISRVCCEARKVALETGMTMRFGEDAEPAQEDDWDASTLRRDVWHDPVRESVHLNWNEVYEVDFYSSGSPIGYLARHASQSSHTGSLMRDYMDPRFMSPHSEPSSPTTEEFLGRGRPRDLAAFKRCSRWLVVMHDVVVHST
ncbi:hypothetical protein LTR27_004500 [Elasticomyces elasticus]|nr:hypothetical protein LTR27_004500 [Elasticomyces elasticus]